MNKVSCRNGGRGSCWYARFYNLQEVFIFSTPLILLDKKWNYSLPILINLKTDSSRKFQPTHTHRQKPFIFVIPCNFFFSQIFTHPFTRVYDASSTLQTVQIGKWSWNFSYQPLLRCFILMAILCSIHVCLRVRWNITKWMRDTWNETIYRGRGRGDER